MSYADRLVRDKRGPRVGDAASLWNFTAAPGWTQDECHILRLCLMRYGVGQWLQILGTGLLPGKLIQQLYGQTQRLLGQQSLAAYTGLKVDVDRIRMDNEARTEGVSRKNGIIIYDGPNLTKEMKVQLREEGREKYGLTQEVIDELDAQIQQLKAPGSRATTQRAANGDAPPVVETPEGEPHLWPKDVQLRVLLGLRRRLGWGVDRLRARLGMAQRSRPGGEDEQQQEEEAGELGAGPGDLPAVALRAAAGGVQQMVRPLGVKDGGVRKRKAGAGGQGVKRAAAAAVAAPAAAGGEADHQDAGPAPPPPAPRAKGGRPSKKTAGGAAAAAGGAQPSDAENQGAQVQEGLAKASLAKPSRAAAAGAKRGGRGGKAKPAKRRRGAERNGDEWSDGDDDMTLGSDVATLTAMGFSPRKARGALAECNFNVLEAADWLCAVYS